MLWWTTGRMTECHREDQRSSGCGRLVPRLLRIQPPMSACAHAWVLSLQDATGCESGMAVETDLGVFKLGGPAKSARLVYSSLFTLLHEHLEVQKVQRASHLDDVGDQAFLALLMVCKLRLQGRQRIP